MGRPLIIVFTARQNENSIAYDIKGQSKSQWRFH